MKNIKMTEIYNLTMEQANELAQKLEIGFIFKDGKLKGIQVMPTALREEQKITA